MRLTGSLKDLAEARKHQTVLIGDVKTHLIKQASQPNDRASDVVHPSELSHHDWCPRHDYYRITGVQRDSETPASVSWQLENVFDEGHTIHAKWQGRLRKMGLLWGDWTCLACGDRFHECFERDIDHDCGAHRVIEYDEVPLRMPGHLLAGRADGAVPDRECLIEIKSVGIGTVRREAPSLLATYEVKSGVYDLDALWKGLGTPFASHIKQANLYLAMAEAMGLDFVKRMVFIYEFKSNQDIKEFTIHRSPSITRGLLLKADTVKHAIESGNPPPVPQEFKTDKPPCTTCPYRSRCWGSD